ncbi:MAG: SIS domain-containing protein [Bacteroidia bacterium]
MNPSISDPTSKTLLFDTYKTAFRTYFDDETVSRQVLEAVEITRQAGRLIFIGNGGSNAICSHMMEDFIKVARIPAVSFTDAALITCFANDYGYPHAILEWLKVIYRPGDTLYAISSSGKSPNILHATEFIKAQGERVITLTGFAPGNPLSQMGDVNFCIPVQSYGIVECFHQTLVHIILDTIAHTSVQTSAQTI